MINYIKQSIFIMLTYNSLVYAEKFIPTFTRQYIFTQHNHTNDIVKNFSPSIHRAYTHQSAHNLIILLSQCYPIKCLKYYTLGLPHDCELIEKICKDNQHYHIEDLIDKLAHTNTINEMSKYIKNQPSLHALHENIIINPEHFAHLPHAEKRYNKHLKYGVNCMHERHKKEINNLQAQYKKACSCKNKHQQEKITNDLNALKKLHTQQIQDGPYVSAQKAVKREKTKQVLSNINQQNKAFLKEPNLYTHQFIEIIQNRNNALEKSLTNLIPEQKQHQLKPGTIGFLQAHHINSDLFTSSHGIMLEQELTQELISIIDSLADNYTNYTYNSTHQALADHCLAFTSLTKQSFDIEHIQQTERAINACHGINHFLQGSSHHDFDQAQEYFSTALHFCTAILRGTLYGVGTTIAAHTVIGAGMAVAPVFTGIALTAATTITAIHIATLCAQGCINAYNFTNYCIQGDYDKVQEYINKTYKTISNLENIEHAAAYLSGFIASYKGLPSLPSNMQYPVITSVQQASGQYNRSIWFLTPAQIEEEFLIAQKILERPEFKNFNLTCQEILGCKIFKVRPPKDPQLAPILQLADMHNLIGAKDQITLGQIFMSQSTPQNKIIQSSIASALTGTDLEFFTTDLGKKMFLAITKPYEEIKLTQIAKDYQKLLFNQTPAHIVASFMKAHEISLLPTSTRHKIESLHNLFHQKHLGIYDNQEHPYLTMHFRHIFYPEISLKFSKDCLEINKINLQGFHHDEYRALETSGLFSYIDPIYGDSEYGASECIAAYLDFKDDIQPQELKTFFPLSWSQEKVTQVIFQAAHHRIQVLDDNKKYETKYLCKGINNLLIEIIINSDNVITSGYPSKKNFKLLRNIKL